MKTNMPLSNNNSTSSKHIVRLPPKNLKRPPILNVRHNPPKKQKQESLSLAKTEPTSAPVIPQAELQKFVQTQRTTQPNKEALLIEFALLRSQEIETRLEQIKTQLKIVLNDGTHKVPGSDMQVRKVLNSKPLKFSAEEITRCLGHESLNMIRFEEVYPLTTIQKKLGHDNAKLLQEMTNKQQTKTATLTLLGGNK